MASSPLRPAAGLCRHPPSSFCRGATIFPRCNPTWLSPSLQFAVPVWGVVGVATAQSLAPAARTCGHQACSLQATSFMHIALEMTTSGLNILAFTMPRHFASFFPWHAKALSARALTLSDGDQASFTQTCRGQNNTYPP